MKNKKRGCLWGIVIVIALIVIINVLGGGNSKDTAQSNPLLSAKFEVGNVMNGTGTDKLGEYGYVSIPKSELKEITSEQLLEFCNKRVVDSSYNWVSIMCEDNTGIVFTGSNIYAGIYGNLDTDGAVLSSIGYINYDGKVFTYEEAAQ